MVPILVLACARACVFHTTKRFNASWVSYNWTHNWTQFWHSILGDSGMFHRLSVPQSYKPPPTPLNSDASLCHLWHLCVICSSDLLATDQKFQWSPTLGSITLLERYTELKGIVSFLDYRFVIKGCISHNPGTATWKVWVEQGMGGKGGASICFLGTPLSPILHICTNMAALWPSFLVVFYEGFIRAHD